MTTDIFRQKNFVKSTTSHWQNIARKVVEGINLPENKLFFI
jgi:hypothetical protein